MALCLCLVKPICQFDLLLSQVCLSLLRANIEKVKSRGVRLGKICVKELHWGCPSLVQGTFDVVIATDCVYAREALQPLFQTATSLLPLPKDACDDPADLAEVGPPQDKAHEKNATGCCFLLAHYPRGWCAAADAEILQSICVTARQYQFSGCTLERDTSDSDCEGQLMQFTPLSESTCNSVD